MNGALPSLTEALVPYVILAIIMVGANLFLLTRAFPRTGGTPHFGTIVLVVGILTMSAILWLALIDAILDPGDSSTVAVFIAGNSMMGVFGAWMIAVFYRAEESRIPAKGWLWPSNFALLVVGSELLMGVAYVLSLAGPAGYTTKGAVGLGALVRDAAGSVWFSWAMLANMVLLLAWLPFPVAERVSLGGLAASAGFAPWVIADSALAVAAMGALMGVVLGYGIWGTTRGRAATVGSVRVLEGVAAAFAVMMATGVAGLALPGASGNTLPFALATVLVMGTELVFIGRWALGRPSGEPPPTDRPTPEATAPSGAMA